MARHDTALTPLDVRCHQGSGIPARHPGSRESRSSPHVTCGQWNAVEDSKKSGGNCTRVPEPQPTSPYALTALIDTTRAGRMARLDELFRRFKVAGLKEAQGEGRDRAVGSTNANHSDAK